MKYLREFVSFLAFWLICVASQSFAQSTSIDEKIASASISQLKTALKDAELFHTLDGAQITLDGQSFCGLYLKETLAAKDELEHLNQMRNKTTDNYSRLAQEAKDNNTRALQQYKNCYAAQLPYFPSLKKVGILTYEAHGAKYDSMVRDYDDIDDLDSYILKLREVIKEREYGASPIVASVLATSGIFEVSTDGVNWKTVGRGHRLRLADRVRTGESSIARIDFSGEFYDKHQVKPAVVDLGPNTEILIANLQGDNKIGENHGFLDLLSGSIRAITRVWNNGSMFSVRAGTTICGIRNTEVAISYNSATETVDYILDHGDAFYKTAGGSEVTMRPKTGVIITRSRASTPRQVSSAEWQGVVQKTSGPFGLEVPPDRPSPVTSIVKPQTTRIAGKSGGKWYTEIERFGGDMVTYGMAKANVENHIQALQDYDARFAKLTSTGDYLQLIQQNTRSQSIKAWLDEYKNRPRSFKVLCSTCMYPNKSCQTLVNIERDADKLGGGVDVVFWVEPHPTKTNVFRMSKADGNPEAVTDFRKEIHVCN